MWKGEIMKTGILSIIFFIIPIVVYVVSMAGGDLFFGPVMILLCIGLPVLGLFLGIGTKVKSLKITGIIGNSLILLVTGVIPLISMYFWNQA